jgi:hypothetical protein
MSLLLLAFPARLRRKHGTELIQTMAELADAKGGPTPADRWRLVLDGLRERFRPPARRPLALAAVVSALLIGGAVGAAAGSYVGTLVQAPMPDAVQLAQRAFPTTEHLSAENSANYLGDAVELPAGTDLRKAANESRLKLAADGWDASPLHSGGIVSGHSFTAVKDGVLLEVDASPAEGGGAGTMSIVGLPQRQASFTVLTIAGALLGLIAGWLTSVALAHRIQASRRRRISTVLSAAGLILALPTSATFVYSLLHYMATDDLIGDKPTSLYATGFVFGPTLDLIGNLDQWTGLELSPSTPQELALWGLALIAVAAILARPRKSPQQTGLPA